MIASPETVVERVAAASGRGEPLADLAAAAARAAGAEGVGAVVAATFSNPERFPSLAVRVAASLGLPPSTPALDVQMACSAYPYAVYLAGKMAADTGKQVVVVDGDVQSALSTPPTTRQARYSPTRQRRASCRQATANPLASTSSHASTTR